MKKGYCNIPLDIKKIKTSFVKAVHNSKNMVSIDLVRNFAAKIHRYMLSYLNIQPEDLTYESIEKFVKKIATHRNMADSNKGCI